MPAFDSHYLQTLPVFNGIPMEHLQWLLASSDILELDAGDILFDVGQSADFMFLLLEGQLNLSVEQNGRYSFFALLKKGEITGYLPFSRLKVSGGRAAAHLPSTVLRLHKEHFSELEQRSPEMIQKLVGLMTDRVREFTRNEQQQEKLVALGKLSAGLAHELNNPASAIVRSASELRRLHHAGPEKLKKILLICPDPDQIDRLNALILPLIEQGLRSHLSLMARSSLEEEIIDWLEQHSAADPFTLGATFASWNVQIRDLEAVAAIMGEQYLPDILEWLAGTLETERAICDIQAATDRISELVNAVKTYSHMDQGRDKERANVAEGINSTLTILTHKLKEKNIRVERCFDPKLPQVQAFVGELNQVWTNLIDNAVDAMPDGGKLTISAAQEGDKLMVRIEDNGHGIPQDVLPHIYEPFFTTKNIGKGTGLGLDIVHKIVAHHNASIKVESEPGKTAFQICFPLD
ncbi:sensor histidine kinase [Arcticibacter sp. MXS-1]|uniref:sensor histidine kinase n=1 Tax=Arcticibacter sp. MXS-1 TaxID=3341726 RepID=UPI0035A93774